MAPRWTAPELNYLQELAGDIPAHWICRHYNLWAATNGRPKRTRASLVTALSRHRFPRRAVGSWVTTGGIAATLGLPSSTVEAWARRRDFPGVQGRQGERRPGTPRYVYRPDLRDWAKKHPQLFGGIDRAALVMLLEDEELADWIADNYPRRPQGLEATARPVRRLDTGEVYPSLSAAGRAVYVHRKAIEEAIAFGRRSAGVHWEFVTDCEDNAA